MADYMTVEQANSCDTQHVHGNAPRACDIMLMAVDHASRGRQLAPLWT